MTIYVAPCGARLTSLLLSNPDGGNEDVVLSRAADGCRDEFRMGAVVGRFAGRIRNAVFQLDGQSFKLSSNDGAHCLHGGSDGFADREWRILHEEHGRDHVFRLGLTSPDGDQGFPGEVSVELEYRWNPDDRLSVQFEANTTRPTPISLTQHIYWNLGGPLETDVSRHRIRVNAAHYLPVDAQRVPTGEIRSVMDTSFDLTRLTPLSKPLWGGHPEIEAVGGFDHCWLPHGDGFRAVAYLDHPPSGRSMTIWTDQPGLQIYTGNELANAVNGISGMPFHKHGGIAFETQALPDAPNQRNFPCSILRPGQAWRAMTIFEFSRLAGDAEQAGPL